MNNLVDSRQIEKGNVKTLITTEKHAIVLMYKQLKNAYLITQNRQNLVVTHSGHSHKKKEEEEKTFLISCFLTFFFFFCSRLELGDQPCEPGQRRRLPVPNLSRAPRLAKGLRHSLGPSRRSENPRRTCHAG
jgi:hypothetical protein